MFLSTVIGNIGADAQVHNKDGRDFITFRVAHNEVWTDQAGTQHSTTIWVDCIMNGKPKVTEFLKAGTQVAVVGTTTLRTYSSEKQRAIVAGATIRVDSVQLLGGQTDDVPRRLYDDHGAMHDVHKAYYSDVKACKLQSQRGDRFNVDANGWITKETPAPADSVSGANTDQSQQNADGSPSQIF